MAPMAQALTAPMAPMAQVSIPVANTDSDHDGDTDMSDVENAFSAALARNPEDEDAEDSDVDVAASVPVVAMAASVPAAAPVVGNAELDSMKQALAAKRAENAKLQQDVQAQEDQVSMTKKRAAEKIQTLQKKVDEEKRKHGGKAPAGPAAHGKPPSGKPHAAGKPAPHPPTKPAAQGGAPSKSARKALLAKLERNTHPAPAKKHKASLLQDEDAPSTDEDAPSTPSDEDAPSTPSDPEASVLSVDKDVPSTPMGFMSLFAKVQADALTKKMENKLKHNKKRDNLATFVELPARHRFHPLQHMIKKATREQRPEFEDFDMNPEQPTKEVAQEPGTLEKAVDQGPGPED